MDRPDPFLSIISKMPGGYHGLEFRRLLIGKVESEKNRKTEWFTRYENEAYAHVSGKAIDEKKREKEEERKRKRDDARVERDVIRRDLVRYQLQTRRPRAGKQRPPPSPPPPPDAEGSCPCAPCTASGMRPASCADKIWLRIGCSWDGDARAKYLRLRYEDWPWDRWCYPPTGNLEYLWAPHLGRSQQGPSYKRLHGVDDFRRRNVAMSTSERPEALPVFTPKPRPAVL